MGFGVGEGLIDIDIDIDAFGAALECTMHTIIYCSCPIFPKIYKQKQERRLHHPRIERGPHRWQR